MSDADTHVCRSLKPHCGRFSKLAADLHTVDGEISGYMRSIAQAQEDNEQLVMQRKRLQAERDKFQRLVVGRGTT